MIERHLHGYKRYYSISRRSLSSLSSHDHAFASLRIFTSLYMCGIDVYIRIIKVPLYTLEWRLWWNQKNTFARSCANCEPT